MGYCIDVEVKVKIPKEKKEDIIATLKRMDTRDYSWTKKGFSNHTSIKDLFEEWRYGCILSTKGYYLVNSFEGEKLGEDAALWKALAPFILDGSYVKFSGEDHAQWKYVFKDGKMKEKWGRTVYE